MIIFSQDPVELAEAMKSIRAWMGPEALKALLTAGEFLVLQRFINLLKKIQKQDPELKDKIENHLNKAPPVQTELII